jgi:hypothetical protein
MSAVGNIFVCAVSGTVMMFIGVSGATLTVAIFSVSGAVVAGMCSADTLLLVVRDLECVLIIGKLVKGLKVFGVTVDVCMLFSSCGDILLAIGIAS